MAVRGVKPKPAHLKVVTGNPGKRPLPGAEEEVEVREEPLVPPRKLTKLQTALWERFIQSAWWLTDHDVPKAYMWVCLQAEHDKKPGDMIAARLGQLRVLGSELGLDPSARARMATDHGRPKSPAGQFFD